MKFEDLYPTFICNSNSFYAFGKGTDDRFYVWGCQQDDPQPFPPSPDGSPWRDFSSYERYTVAITCGGKAYLYKFQDVSKLDQVKPILIKNYLLKSFIFTSYYEIGITLDNKAFMWKLNYSKLDLEDVRLIHCPNNGTWETFYSTEYYVIGMTKEKKAYVLDSHLHIPEILPSQSDSPWSTFFCADVATFGVTLDGTFYTWEDNCMYTLLNEKPKVFPPPTSDDQWAEVVFGKTDLLDSKEYILGKTRNRKVYIWGPGRRFFVDQDKDVSKDVPTELCHPDTNVTWINVFCTKFFTIAIDSNFHIYDIHGHLSSKTPPPSRGVKWKIFTQNESKVDILEALDQHRFSDLKIGPYDVHSSLIELRCPLLLKISDINETLSKEALSLLIRLIYGESDVRLYYVNLTTLLDLYQFLRSHEIEDFKSIIYKVIVDMMKEKAKLIEIIELLSSTRYDFEEILSNVFHFKYYSILFSEESSEEEIYNQLNLIKSEKFKTLLATMYISDKNPNPYKKRKTILTHVSIDHHVDNIKNLRRCLRNLYQTGQGSDLTITFRDQSFSVHRFVLCARSKYFQNLMQPTFKEHAMDKIDLSDIHLSSSTMIKFMEYLYSDTISSVPTEIESVELLIAQDYFLFDNQRLKSFCKNAIQKTEDIQNILSIAFQHRNHDALQFILVKFFSKDAMTNVNSKLSCPVWCENFASLLLNE